MAGMNSIEERWLPIPGYEGRYDVSDLGRVRSWNNAGGRMAEPRIKKQTLSPGMPYRVVGLSNGHGVSRIIPIHRLVMLAFVGPLPKTFPRSETRHLNGDKLDNRLVNLRYGTAIENRLDSVRHGTNYHASATHCKRGHPFDEANTYHYTNASGNPSRRCRTCVTWQARQAYKDRHFSRQPSDTLQPDEA
jgi:hypothetical protein